MVFKWLFFQIVMMLAACDLNTGAGTTGRDRGNVSYGQGSQVKGGAQEQIPGEQQNPGNQVPGSPGMSPSNPGDEDYREAVDTPLGPQLQLQTLIEELESTRRVGCRGRESIVSLELRVNGRHLDDKALGRSENRRTSGEEATQIAVSFAEGVGFGFHERDVQIFSEEGVYPTGDLSAYLTSSLRYLEIKKGGPGYRDVEVSEGSIFDEDVLYEGFETERYEIRDVEIWINNEKIYQKKNIQTVLEQGSLAFRDDALLEQPLWFAYMAESDCQAGL